MKEKLAKLIDVKSLVTLSLTAGFLYLSIVADVPEPFKTVYLMIIGFYFGTQAQKKADGV